MDIGHRRLNPLNQVYVFNYVDIFWVGGDFFSLNPLNQVYVFNVEKQLLEFA